MKFLHTKDICVCAGINQSKRQNVIFYQINQKPVRLYMALAKTLEVAGQPVVMVFGVKCFSLSKLIDYFIKKRNIQAALFHKLITSLISRGEFYIIHRYSSNAFLSSSMLAYPSTLGSREIRLASSIAASVCWL